MTAVPFDFRMPSSGQGERRASAWLAQASQAAPKKWAFSLGFPAELSLERVERRLPPDVLKSLSETAVGVTLHVDGNAEQPAFLGMDRSLLLALLSGLLGVPAQSLPEDRDLTPVERSLVEFLLQQFLEPIQEAWPGNDQLRLTFINAGPPRTACLLPPDRAGICATLSVRGPFGAGRVWLLVQESGPFAPDEVVSQSSSTAFSRDQWKSALSELPARFSVVLGQSQLTLQQLTSLKPGDIVVLERRIAEPLDAQVEGTDKYQVWPGALGRNQAVRIHAVQGLGTR
jgi:flagellar motor switch protein FliM